MSEAYIQELLDAAEEGESIAVKGVINGVNFDMDFAKDGENTFIATGEEADVTFSVYFFVSIRVLIVHPAAEAEITITDIYHY